jgi:hypothetical protein
MAVSLSPVVGLFLGGRPSTVAGFVPLVVVDAIERLSFRARPHVVGEVFKPHPALTYGDTSGPVVRKAGRVRVRASVNHGSPSGHLWGHRAARVGAMRCDFGSNLLPTKTSATGGSAGSKHAELVALLAPTVAYAPPDGASLGGSSVNLYSNQRAETLPGDIDTFPHWSDYNGEWQ